MPDCKHYGGITRAELGNLREDLAKEGISIPSGDDVTVEGPYGIRLRAIYDETKETLIHYHYNEPERFPTMFIKSGLGKI